MTRTVAGALGLFIVGAGIVLYTQRTTPRIVTAIPWAESGVWLKADTHVHTTFSDGGPLDAVVDQAVANGCDVLAITDHTDGGLKSATPEYHAAIAAARARLPQLLILTGIEWNVPPGKGNDHAVVLFPPEMDDATVTGEFKERFDDFNKEGENPELAVAAFKWLRSKGAAASVLPVMFLDHPSRKAKDVAAVKSQIEWLSEIGADVFVGVEGAPGHQNAKPLGAYGGALEPDDRWDPAVAPPGAAWDQLLATGTDKWGALATSDFHSTGNGDYWPCQFSATWVYAPDRSAIGVLRALRAGSFVGVHGGIARDVQLRVTAPGLERAAIAGETIRVPARAAVTIDIEAMVPETDWAGQPNRIDNIQLIATSESGTSVVYDGPLGSNGRVTHQEVVPRGGLTIRARGRRVVEDGPDLLFYTNAIRVN